MYKYFIGGAGGGGCATLTRPTKEDVIPLRRVRYAYALYKRGAFR